MIICLLFHFCLDPDPKQIIPDLDPQYRFYLLRLLGSVLNFDSIHQRNNIHFHRTDGRVPFYLCPLWGRADILNQSASLPPPPPYSRSGSAPSPGGTEKGGGREYTIFLLPWTKSQPNKIRVYVVITIVFYLIFLKLIQF